MKKYRSLAEWNRDVDPVPKYTSDEHDTEDQANAVCKKLEKEGYGGYGLYFPVRTWVEPITLK